jgi:hypothetical protein
LNFAIDFEENAEFWCQFDPSIQSLFEGLNNKSNINGPFNNATRILLVDTILKNLSFSADSYRAKLKIISSINNTLDSSSFDVTSLINNRNEDAEIAIDYQKGLERLIFKSKQTFSFYL